MSENPAKPMVNNVGKQWENEVITNRVTVSKNPNNVRVSIKAPAFAWSNNMLTLLITIGLVAEVALAYLMIKSSVSLAVLIPGFIALGAGLGISFVKLWLWHYFGEELINIKGNSFEMHRNYGLFRSDVCQLQLNDQSELFTNRTDKWSWREFRGKGIFRLATMDAKLVDFGLNLDEQEFEMIIRPVTSQLDNLKKQAEGIQVPQAEQKTEVVATEVETAQETEVQKDESIPVSSDVSSRTLAKEDVSSEALAKEEATVEEEVTTKEDVSSEALAKEDVSSEALAKEEEIQPPSLERQTEGRHLDALNDYLEKTTTGKVAGASSTSKAKSERKAKT